MVKKHYLYILLIPAAIYLTAKFGYAHNITESLPHKHFIIIKTTNVHRGDYILFDAPRNSKYEGIKLIKQVLGIEGDQVWTDNQKVYVNLNDIGIAKKYSKNGDVLTKTPAQIIPAAKFFVANNHVDSFDSRYAEFGLIDEKNIIGVAIAMW